jgi:hypothetical protein
VNRLSWANPNAFGERRERGHHERAAGGADWDRELVFPDTKTAAARRPGPSLRGAAINARRSLETKRRCRASSRGMRKPSGPSTYRDDRIMQPRQIPVYRVGLLDPTFIN